ncbi:MAG: efflux RND transporter periplasmic adaptor subunit [Gallionella sp.]|nr:efflux RND transporter periplasmic adaptor subunit [Gallionella sp.]
MKPISRIIIGVLALLGIGATGYWFGSQNTEGRRQGTEIAVQKEPVRKILHYRNPMGLADTSPVPKKDAMGMDYVPVYEGGDETGGGNQAASAGSGQVKISVEKVQKLGVRTGVASLRALDKTVRAVGRVEVNERHVYNIAPKFEGWIEKLHVNATGDFVKKGQALFDVYSPELVSAQREYAIATQGVASLKGADDDARRSMRQLADAGLLRLKNWDISEQQVKDLAKSATTKHSLTFFTPVNGIVLEKKAFEGMRFMPGEMLYQIADLSSVWVIADVFEQDIALVKTGARAKVKINAYPDKVFGGVITYVYPTLNPATRTVPVRLEIANPHGLLKPAMFAQVEVSLVGEGKVLTVPVSAVIDSGTRQIALVQLAEGRFEPREISLGRRSDNYVEVLDGIVEGEQVVVAANFLIDAESNLKAALGGLGQAYGDGAGGAKSAMEQVKPAVVGHQAEGTLDAVDSKAGSATLTHGPIKALGWPGMTMEFALANPSLVSNIKIGSAVTFEIVERKPGEWVITRLQAKQSAHSQHEGR